MKIVSKNVFRSFLRRFLMLLLLLFLFITVSAISYVTAISENLSENLFRLHVVANSDSKEDQNLKILVRDSVLEYVNILSANSKTKTDIVNLVSENISEIKTVAKEVISNNGYNYDINVEVGTFSFPTKYYGDISIPAGIYDALKIEIGTATRAKLVVCNVSPSMFCRHKFRNCTRIF